MNSALLFQRVLLLCGWLSFVNGAAGAGSRSIVDEPLLFTGVTKTNASAQLLWVPSRAPHLGSSDGGREYAIGKDYVWKRGTRLITLTADSQIPFKTTTELHPAPNSPNAYRHQRGNTNAWMFFGPGHVMHDLQTFARYTTRDAWEVPQLTAAPDSQLGGLRSRLKAKQPIKLVVLGDSISTGADASAIANVAPRQAGYPELIAKGIASRFGVAVTMTNFSVGGMDSAWGATRVASVIGEKPDLLIVAFGMNDASGQRTPEEFSRLTRSIFEPVRGALPGCAMILVSSMTANSDWVYASPDLYPQYAIALSRLTGPGVAFADVTTVWSAIAERKKHLDLSGNGLNHPNDYGHRLYSDTILSVIGKVGSN